MQFTVESSSAAIAAALRRAAQEISDTTPMMAAIGQRLETNIRSRFDSKTDPADKAWAPYKAISAAIHKASSTVNHHLVVCWRGKHQAYIQMLITLPALIRSRFF